ncbi:transcriptional regulator [Blastochloris viridis]|uniref:Transcriptional regulator n=1 Tax=Blastochloris viridis TaxID=1079 RepID=A0A182CYS6_BLAVI|nr:transcriptional regulator [Blastochloris viridis]
MSRETIRRDLKLLANRGELEVVHGGAMRRDTLDIPQPQRTTRDSGASGRQAIGQLAASLIEDGATVLLDSGALAGAIVSGLLGKRDITVCTHSLTHALALVRHPLIRVFVLGGQVDATEEAAFGVDTVLALDSYSCDLAFISARGFTSDGEPTDTTRHGAELRARMLLAARRPYLLADHAQFQRTTPIRIPNSDRAAGLLVDHAPPETLADAFRRNGLPVTVAGTSVRTD